MLKFLIVKFSIIGLLIFGYTSWKDNQEDAAQAYFDARCKDAGEFIYRTVENVEGVFQMRERDPRDYIDRLRSGDLMEDPYGHTNIEAQRPWKVFLRNPSRPTYHFFETSKGPSIEAYDLYKNLRIFSERPNYTDQPYWHYSLDGLRKNFKSEKYWTMLKPQQVSELKSQYGFTWHEVQTEQDKQYGVIGGELIVKELATDETLGIRRGFFFWPKVDLKPDICPKRKHDTITFEFVSKVLKPKPFKASSLMEKDYGY